MVALTARPQQTATRPGGTDTDEHGQSATQDDVPTVRQMLKVLTEKLDLTGDQQSRIKPILQKLHDTQQKLAQDKRLSRDERLAKVRPQRCNADKQIRNILTRPEDEARSVLTGAAPWAAWPPERGNTIAAVTTAVMKRLVSPTCAT